MKRKNQLIGGLLVGILVGINLPAGSMAQQKNDTIHSDGNINISDFLTYKRRAADKFESKKGTEHLFFSAAAGMSFLPDIGSGNKAHGLKASFMVGNWLTPVIGIRASVDYAMWKHDGANANLIGAGVDYLINISAFAAHYNPKRLFEVVASIGGSYQATLISGASAIHSYGLRVGLQGKFNINPAFNLFIEPGLSLYPDRVDGAYSWRRYDIAPSVMAGITYKPSRFSQSNLLQNGFASLGVGIGNTGDLLLNTELALGKWFGKGRVNGVRISVGSSTAFLENYDGVSDKDFNINLSADYLCNLTAWFADRKSRIFDLIFIGGVGSYFPGSEALSSIIFNGRFGFQGQIRLSEHTGLWVEPRVNLFKDKSYRADLQEPIRGTIGLMIGMNYKF